MDGSIPYGSVSLIQSGLYPQSQLSFPHHFQLEFLLIHDVNILRVKGVSFDNFWSRGKAWAPKRDPSHWLSHHKAEHKNQMLYIFQGTSIFKLILPQERIRASSRGGVDVTLSHHFQMLMLDGPDLMKPMPKGQVGDSDFSQKVKNINRNFSRKAVLSSQLKFAPLAAVCSFSGCFTAWILSDLILSWQGGWGEKRKSKLAYQVSAMWGPPYCNPALAKSLGSFPWSSSGTSSSFTGAGLVVPLAQSKLPNWTRLQITFLPIFILFHLFLKNMLSPRLFFPPSILFLPFFPFPMTCFSFSAAQVISNSHWISDWCISLGMMKELFIQSIFRAKPRMFFFYIYVQSVTHREKASMSTPGKAASRAICDLCLCLTEKAEQGITAFFLSLSHILLGFLSTSWPSKSLSFFMCLYTVGKPESWTGHVCKNLEDGWCLEKRWNDKWSKIAAFQHVEHWTCPYSH